MTECLWSLWCNFSSIAGTRGDRRTRGCSFTGLTISRPVKRAHLVGENIRGKNRPVRGVVDIAGGGRGETWKVHCKRKTAQIFKAIFVLAKFLSLVIDTVIVSIRFKRKKKLTQCKITNRWRFICVYMRQYFHNIYSWNIFSIQKF